MAPQLFDAALASHQSRDADQWGAVDMDRRSFLSSAGVAAVSAACGAMPFASHSSWAQVSVGSTTLIVPGPGGSRSGLAGRILGAALQQETGMPVEVAAVDSPREGYLMLAGAAADGRTYGLIGADMPALEKGLGNSPGVGSITPIAKLSEDPAGIHVRRDAPWRNASELIASLRSSQGRIRASGAGRYAVWHLSAQRWMMAAGAGSGALSWEAAPTPAAAVEDLAAGGADIVICSVPEVRAAPQARQIRTLAVMSPRRSARYPDIAAIGEGGLAVRAGWWRGLAGPRGLAQGHVARMQAALHRVHASAAFRNEMTKRGFSLDWAGTSQFAHFIAREDRATAAAMRSLT